MTDASGYYVALLASAVSTLAWLAVPAGALATAYFFLTDGPVETAGLATLGAVAVAIAFARVEKRFYRVK